MTRVFRPQALACRTEWLAWAGARPDWLIVRPAGQSERIGPSTDTGKEVTLPEFMQVVWSNKSNVSLIDLPVRNQANLDKLSQPSRSLWVDFVVIRSHSLVEALCFGESFATRRQHYWIRRVGRPFSVVAGHGTGSRPGVLSRHCRVRIEMRTLPDAASRMTLPRAHGLRPSPAHAPMCIRYHLILPSATKMAWVRAIPSSNAARRFSKSSGPVSTAE